MENFIPVSIGLIQVFFFSKLANKLFDKRNKRDCHKLKYDTPEYEQCYKLDDEERDKKDTNKFIFMMAVATVIFVVVSQLDTTNDVKFGTGLGAFFMIVYALFMHWTHMNETMKLTVLGTSLCVLLYGASKTSTMDFLK
jgi:hypothetical protein